MTSVPDTTEGSTVEPLVAKKSYSIWSLIVMMTLLAVWLAIPRRIASTTEPVVYLMFVILHQLVFWSINAALLWMFLGKRRILAYVAGGLVFVAVLPMLLLLCDTIFYSSDSFPMFNWVLSPLAIREPYVWMMVEVFGYDF